MQRSHERNFDQLLSEIYYFRVLSMLQSLFIRLAVFVWEGEPGKKATATLRRSSSKGLGTSEVKIAITVVAFALNKMASSNLEIREEEKPSDRPEPAQITRGRSLKQINVFPTRSTIARGHLK